MKPLKASHTGALTEVARDESIWTYHVHRLMDEPSVRAYVEKALEERERGTAYPWVLIDKETNRVAGTTRLGHLSVPDRRVQVGWTWLGKAFRGTGLNKAAKFELFRFCFETLVVERIEIKTDCLNRRARHSLEKLGVREEGVLRSHTVMHEGRRRDTVVYGLLRTEWEDVRRACFPEFSGFSG